MPLNSQCEPAEPDTQTTTPAISVLMPTYNGERFLRPAIESILNQTFPNFELIVIDDGSTDNTPHILSEFNDTRLTVLTNPKNSGIAAATNRALAAARAEYIALQDHDDISLPHRLQTQLDFLNTHPEIALVGSAATLIDENGTAFSKKFALGIWANRHNLQSQDDLNLKWDALFGCPFYHVSVMVRCGVILGLGGYSEDPEFQYAQDFELLSRITMRHRVANLDAPLVLWRRHPEAAGRSCSQRQQQSNDNISFRNLCMVHNAITGDAQFLPLNHPADNLRYLFDGFKAFLHMPNGGLPNLPSEQVLAGADFIYRVQNNFYRMHRFSRRGAARHRVPYNWLWGKHALALALRAPWDLRSRIRMFAFGLRSLGRAAAAFPLQIGSGN